LSNPTLGNTLHHIKALLPIIVYILLYSLTQGVARVIISDGLKHILPVGENHTKTPFGSDSRSISSVTVAPFPPSKSQVGVEFHFLFTSPFPSQNVSPSRRQSSRSTNSSLTLLKYFRTSGAKAGPFRLTTAQLFLSPVHHRTSNGPLT
jgi:hypothetical protein